MQKFPREIARMRNQMMAGGKRRGVDLESHKGGTTRRRKTSEYLGAWNGGEGRAPGFWCGQRVCGTMTV